MDSAWSSDNRTVQPAERYIKTISGREYPLVNQGLNNTISVVERDRRLKWDFLVLNDPDAEGSLWYWLSSPRIEHVMLGSTLRATEPQTLFPSSRFAPLKPPRITARERAEQGANFLRTFLPDIEITAELIREQIIEDEGYLKKLREFDPFSGTLLASLTPRTTSSSPTVLLCYSMGELNTDLNISPFTVSDSSSLNFTPKATAIHTFNTPIQQIATSSPRNPFEATQDSFLAVRTYGPTFFFQLSSATDLRQISVLESTHTDERSMMDVKLDGSSRRASVVNERGSVYQLNLTEDKVV
ncbi:hypothetical protein ONZ45_g17329 [Pleurotus djamor]|nr:hypothetical protein ONZ45_g17329 [Pleurotus djamor]